MLVPSSSQIEAQIVWGGLKFLMSHPVTLPLISFQIKLSLFPAGIQLFILLWVMDAFETITQSLHFYHDYATELYKDSDRVLQFDHVEANFLNL